MTKPMTDDDLICLCDNCHRASCWQGLFMCDKAHGAGIVYMTRKQLREGQFGEHESYWKTDEEVANGS